MKLRKCSREEFISNISTDPDDKFAKTFVAKADMLDQWGECWGVFEDTKVMAAIITTVSKRKPHVANLQLLHTFARYRGKGAARFLCEKSLVDMKSRGVSFFRVSSEPSAVGFYKKIGFKFWGKQKSGCQLSIFRITSDSFFNCEYDYTDSVIYNAVNKKGKGGCVEIFDTASVYEVASLTQF